ncbi:GNAT family N-acetyltransferase [Agrobacterium sp. SORGH_AS 787]|uniref:GNAT family N-acetyltransferase n=1 Tax=Agrobacterium sp. SORGH_AS 787 TaxID=3041775 RepID=UPI002789C40E|nr:ribosomal protein S18 acetylase RimI-like enzyme [Rhizobium sp. SORGH_AS_0787]
MDETLVRAAEKSDLPALLDLYQHLSPGDQSPDLPDAEAIFDQFLAYRGSVIVVCQVGSVLVGSCVLVVIPNLTRGGRPYALIENVVTHSDFRRQGIGKRVLDFATAHAWQAGCYKVTLMTGSTRPETHAFYRNAGFEPSKTGFQKRQLPARGEG